MQKKFYIFPFFIFTILIIFHLSCMGNEIVKPIQFLKKEIQSTLHSSTCTSENIKSSIKSVTNKVNHDKHQLIKVWVSRWWVPFLQNAEINIINHNSSYYYQHKCSFWPRFHHFAQGTFYSAIAFSGITIYFGYKNQSCPIPWQNIGLITSLLATSAALYEFQKVAFPSVSQALNLQKLKESLNARH